MNPSTARIQVPINQIKFFELVLFIYLPWQKIKLVLSQNVFLWVLYDMMTMQRVACFAFGFSFC
jgi:hypothetical protein